MFFSLLCLSGLVIACVRRMHLYHPSRGEPLSRIRSVCALPSCLSPLAEVCACVCASVPIPPTLCCPAFNQAKKKGYFALRLSASRQGRHCGPGPRVGPTRMPLSPKHNQQGIGRSLSLLLFRSPSSFPAYCTFPLPPSFP